MEGRKSKNIKKPLPSRASISNGTGFFYYLKFMYIIITEKNRIDRLLIAKEEIEKHGVNPLSIKDHKGTLEVTWDFEPGITDKRICGKVWRELNEYLVEHIYPKTIREMVEL